MNDDQRDICIGIVGARGYVGSELIALVEKHPRFALGFVSSRERMGQPLARHEAGYTGDLHYLAYGPEQAAGQGVDAVVLALPNGKAAPYVEALEAAAPETCVVDLSADHRCDEDWHYGLPELTRGRYAGQRRISNPGCYATAMQLAIAPMLDLLAAPAQCFGVSGWSGAGTEPSDKNDPDKLHDNLMPYALTGHMHGLETSRQLRHEVEFMPHVAPHFRGLTVTVNLHLVESFTADEACRHYRAHYAGEALVRVLDEAPWVSRIAGCHHAELGGFSSAAHGRRLVVVATLDNLLKGAATQALQNLNRAFGLDETTGIPLQSL